MNLTYRGYDPLVIEVFAKRLYRRASAMVIRAALAGGLVGGIAGAGVGLGFCRAMQRVEQQGAAVGFLLGALVAGYWAMSSARERAFSLCLQAQVALCQVQIEKNTRKPTEIESGESLSQIAPG